MTDHRRLDALRSGRGEIENNLIDELVQGHMDRSTFLQRGTMFGLSLPLLGAISSAVGAAPALASERRVREAVKTGGNLRVGIVKPPKYVDPYLVYEEGGLETIFITGEYLCYSTTALTLQPMLALSWTPNQNASVWNFKLRQGVHFHGKNGKPGPEMTSKDVVATFKRLTGSKSSAASAYKGILAPGGVVANGKYGVTFHLTTPTASFPYLVSSTTYQAIIQPHTYKVGTWQATQIGTGPYQMKSYSAGKGGTYVRNNNYWGPKPPLDKVTVTYFENSTALVIGLKGGQVDLIGDIAYSDAAPMFSSSTLQVFSTRATTHRMFCLRVDKPPLDDYRVRQAIALSLNRPQIIQTLFSGKADLGNDSPFAPVYPSTNKTVPQRHQDIAQAKALLAAAGKSNASFTITAPQYFEIPQYAQIIQQACKAIGLNVTLNILSYAQYYTGDSTTVPWLNADATITDWAQRAVPNQYLTAAYTTGGVWNAPHYGNPKLDTAIKAYVGAIELPTQLKYSKQIESILLHDTPAITSYFYNYLAAGTKKVKGYKPDAVSLINLHGVSLA
jgi:peptide/nickel transport system substrate-binding protein